MDTKLVNESTETKRQLNYWDLSSTGYKSVNESMKLKDGNQILVTFQFQIMQEKIHLVKRMHMQDVDTKEEDIYNI